MSVRRLAPTQPESFSFTPENLKWAQALIAKYPEGKQASAVIPLLWRAQEQNDGWVSEPAIRTIAEMLDMAQIRVLEVATFYTMFNLKPVGKYFVQLCGTTPCMLRGAEEIKDVCRKVIGPQSTVTEDGMFSWLEVECLGACVNAPMVQINKDYYEDLTPENFEKVLTDLRAGKEVKPGPQNGRQFSAPEGGQLTLLQGGLESELEDGLKDSAAQAASSTASAQSESAGEIISDDKRPEKLDAARDGKPDDLKRISGVGPKLEGKLNDLGIFHYDQIAAWSADHIAWVDQVLSFKGRIEREDWIGQAKVLARGGETEFSKRADGKED